MSVIPSIHTVLMFFSVLFLLIKYECGSVDIDARGGGAKEEQEDKYYLK